MRLCKLAGLTLALVVFFVFVSGCGSNRAIYPFNGMDLKGWNIRGDKDKSKWTVGVAKMSAENSEMLVVQEGQGELINASKHHGDSLDIYTQAKFGDCRIELEVMVPKGSNSGIYLMGKYELQVGDSYCSEEVDEGGTIGAIYDVAAPLANACKKPGQWQKFVIEFHAPRFDAQGYKIANAKFVKVTLNGKLLHKNVEVSGPTGARADTVKWEEESTAPLMFQGNHGPVAYRNIRVTELSRAN